MYHTTNDENLNLQFWKFTQNVIVIHFLILSHSSVVVFWFPMVPMVSAIWPCRVIKSLLWRLLCHLVRKIFLFSSLISEWYWYPQWENRKYLLNFARTIPSVSTLLFWGANACRRCHIVCKKGRKSKLKILVLFFFNLVDGRNILSIYNVLLMFISIVLMACWGENKRDVLIVEMAQIKFQFCQHLTGNYEFYSSSSIRLRNDVVDGKFAPLDVSTS